MAPLAVVGGLVAVQLPVTLRMLWLSRRPAVALHAAVMYLRAFARTFGFLSGLASGAARPGASGNVQHPAS